MNPNRTVSTICGLMLATLGLAGCKSSHPVAAGPPTPARSPATSAPAPSPTETDDGGADDGDGGDDGPTGNKDAAFCAALGGDDRSMTIIMSQAGSLTGSQKNTIERDYARLASVAPNTIRPDVDTVVQFIDAVLTDPASVGGLDDAKVGTAERAYATYVQEHCES